MWTVVCGGDPNHSIPVLGLDRLARFARVIPKQLYHLPQVPEFVSFAKKNLEYRDAFSDLRFKMLFRSYDVLYSV